MDEKQKVYELWSTQLGMTIDELEEEFKQILEDNKKEHPQDTEQIRLFRTLARQQAFHSQQFKSGGKIFECVIIGAGSSYDPYKAERKEAKEKGFVNAKDQPLFWSKRFEWKWKDKDGSIKEITIPSEQSDDSCSRRVYAVVKAEGQDQWKPAIAFLNGKKLCENLPDFYLPTKVKLGIKEEKLSEEILSLNSTSTTKFMVQSNKPVNFKEMSESLLPKNYVPFEDLVTVPNSDNMPLGLLITSGTVVNVVLTKEDVKSNAIELMKTSKGFEDLTKVGTEVETKTFWIPKDIPLKFGVGSEIMMVVQKAIRQDKDGKDTENYNCLGMYAIYSTAPEVAPQEIKMVEAKDDVEIITPSQVKKSDVPW